MQEFETSLRESVSCYKRILTLLKSMYGELGTAPEDELLAMSASLRDLQASASKLDQKIMVQLQERSTIHESLNTLLKEREAIIHESLLLNGNIAAKACGVKALLAHELATLRSGASAMKGYRQQEFAQGRIVNSNS